MGHLNGFLFVAAEILLSRSGSSEMDGIAPLDKFLLSPRLLQHEHDEATD